MSPRELVVHIVVGKERRIDALCPDCLNPSLVEVDVYGYGDDPMKAYRFGTHRMCDDGCSEGGT